MKKNSENSGRNKIDGFEEYSLRRKKRAIWTAAGCVIAALMVVGISFALRSQGRALASDEVVTDTNVGGSSEIVESEAPGIPVEETTITDNPNGEETSDLGDGDDEKTPGQGDETGKDPSDSGDETGKDPSDSGDETGKDPSDSDNKGEQQPTGKLDISDKVTSVAFYTASSQGNGWIPKTDYSFDSNDSVKAEFTCSLEDIKPVSQLASGAYVLLPESIPLPDEMKNKTFKFYDNKVYAGTYQLSCDSNGKPRADFTFDADYLARVGSDGWIKNLLFDFEFKWNVKLADGEEEQRKIFINGQEQILTIKVTNQSSNSNQKTGYSAYKFADATKYDSGKMLITYKIVVDVYSKQNKPIELLDKIDRGTDFYIQKWEYNGSSGSSGNDHGNYVNLTNDSGTEKKIIIGDANGVDAGKYTIYYTASFDVGELQNAEVNSITNTITGDGTEPSSAVTYTNMNLMTKNGEVKNHSDGVVEWTVWINNGAMPYTFKDDETFTDTLPAGTSLADNKIEIFKYDANRNLKESWSVEQPENTTLITATLPKGENRYKIVYKTKQNKPPQPGVPTTVVNKAEISGDIDYTTSASVTLAPAAAKKTMGDVLTKSRTYYTKPDGTKLQVMEIEWSVWLASVNAGDTYIDKGVSWAVPLLMSPEQIDGVVGVDGKDGIVVKCAGTPNPLVKNKDYVITQPDSSKGEDFLFKIEFLTTQTGEVTIDYTCYADVTNVAGDGFNAYNEFGGAQAGGWLTNKFKSQSNNLFKYVEGSDANKDNRITNSKIAIGTNKTLKWVILAEPKYNPDTLLDFKDTLPKGLSFVEGSLKVTAEWDIDVGPDYYQYNIEKDTNGNDVITLTVDLRNKQVGYKDFSNPKVTLDRLVITYDTLITDPSDGGQSKEYTNTVEWDGNIVDQNVTVTRDVIGKNGSFDENTGMLRYSVIINPDGVDLNPDGNLLRVEDTLKGPDDINFKLDGVTLYSLTNASDGSGKKVPGSKIAELQLLPGEPTADGSTNKYYYDDKTYTFTAFIPDNTGYALVYNYRIMTTLKNNIDVSNKVSLYGGSKSYGSTQTSTKVLSYAANASISSAAVNLRLEKRDKDYHDTLLAGAEFTVSRWDENEGNWLKDNVYTTGADGSVALSGLKPDFLYKVEETKAPDGYAINKEIQYFMFAEDPDKVSIPNEVSVSGGEKNMTKEDVTIYQYGNGIKTSVMEWFDKRSGTTDILVEKVWKDGGGTEITWDKGSLNFDLYRKTVPKDQIPDYVEGKTYIYELTEADLNDIKDNYEGYKTSHEHVGEYTLTPSEEGKWELLIEDLEQTDKDGNVYQYYLVETSMGKDTLSESDYWMGVQYKNTSGTGQGQAEITVTNTIVSDYSLPETGAEGSWTDRIKGWFQERYQKIVNYFRKG